MMNYNNKTFKAVSNTDNGEIDAGTLFNYRQQGNLVTCEYKTKDIIYGHLIALVQEGGSLNMRYHQLNAAGELMTGVCNSTPEVMPNGKIRLHEKWQWTSGDLSKGESVLEEV